MREAARLLDCSEGEQATILPESPIPAFPEQLSPESCSPADLNVSSQTLPPAFLAPSPGSATTSPSQGLRIGPGGTCAQAVGHDALGPYTQHTQLVEAPKSFLVNRINVLEGEVTRLTNLTKMLLEECCKSRNLKDLADERGLNLQTPRLCSGVNTVVDQGAAATVEEAINGEYGAWQS